MLLTSAMRHGTLGFRDEDKIVASKIDGKGVGLDSFCAAAGNNCPFSYRRTEKHEGLMFGNNIVDIPCLVRPPRWIAGGARSAKARYVKYIIVLSLSKDDLIDGRNAQRSTR